VHPRNEIAAGLSLRVRLDPLRVELARPMFDVLADERIYEFISERPPKSVEHLEARYEILATRLSPDATCRWLNWCVFSIKDRRYVGYVQATVPVQGDSAEIAYVFSPLFWGQGFAFNAVAVMLSMLARDYGCKHFIAHTEMTNLRSVSLLRRLGFIRESAAGDPYSEQCFSLTILSAEP